MPESVASGPSTVIGLGWFGASAPADRLYQEFGIKAEAVVARIRELV